MKETKEKGGVSQLTTSERAIVKQVVDAAIGGTLDELARLLTPQNRAVLKRASVKLT